MKSAVLFLIFNRPETTIKVFEKIRAAAGAAGYQVCPRAYSNADILHTPSPSLQQYGNVNADLPT